MGDPVDPSPEAEISQLRARIAALEASTAEMQQRAQTLQESETRLRFIVEGSNDGAWDWNMRTNEAFFSARWFELLGYTPDELPNTADTWFSRLHPDEVPQITQLLQDYVAGRVGSFEIENRMLQKSGAWIWTISRGKIVVRDDAGQPVRMTGTMRDISERKQTEEDLRSSQRLLQAVISHSPSVIYIRDMENRYLMVNQNHARLFQMTPEQVVGKRDEELFAPASIEVFRRSDQIVQQQGRAITVEEIVPRKDGSSRIYLSARFPLYDDQGTLYALGGISTDITDSRSAAAERAALQEQIIDAQRNALRELSTPLIPIAEGVVIMPLIGSIDEMRAQQVMENLLQGVEVHHATSVILDVTGVELVDTHVAGVLVRAAQAVKLLGARAIVTGIRPEIAQTIIGMGQDLSGLTTLSSLQAGIAFALKQRMM